MHVLSNYLRRERTIVFPERVSYWGYCKTLRSTISYAVWCILYVLLELPGCLQQTKVLCAFTISYKVLVLISVDARATTHTKRWCEKKIRTYECRKNLAGRSISAGYVSVGRGKEIITVRWGDCGWGMDNKKAKSKPHLDSVDSEPYLLKTFYGKRSHSDTHPPTPVGSCFCFLFLDSLSIFK